MSLSRLYSLQLGFHICLIGDFLVICLLFSQLLPISAFCPCYLLSIFKYIFWNLNRSICKGNSQFSSVQSLSHVQLFATPWTTACQASLCITNSLTQTHVHWVGDAIQASHPLSSPSPPALNVSQHQGLFQWVNSLHQVVKVLALQHQFIQCIFRTDFL